jgi:hypothetical protein
MKEYVSKTYELRGKEEIEQFLSEHEYLWRLLFEIPGKVKKYFGEDEKLALRMFHDPECIGCEHLVVMIKTSKTVDETLKCLDNFDEGWWIDVTSDRLYSISVNTEYV